MTISKRIYIIHKWTVTLCIIGFFLSAQIGLSFPNTVYAQDLSDLPKPGSRVALSSQYNAPFLKGITMHPENPFRFDFIIDRGHSDIHGMALKPESTKLIKYFLASLTIPEEEQWVNLSPYEKKRIIPEALGLTELGRDMLAQDYLLKQLSASLIYPEEELGEKFWEDVYHKAYDVYGTTEIPVNTFNKVWIVPDKAVVYEHGQTAIIIETRLKVMLEEDYLAMRENLDNDKIGTNKLAQEDVASVSNISSDIVRTVVLPEIAREVNHGKNFACLRQIYHSMILATWYKNKLKETLLAKAYADHKKITGIDLKDKAIKEKIFHQYLAAFKRGVYDYIKEDYDPYADRMIPRKYFAGGLFGGTQLKKALVTVDATNHALRLAEASPTNEDGFDIVSADLQPVNVNGMEVLRLFLKTQVAELMPQAVRLGVLDEALAVDDLSDRAMLEILSGILVQKGEAEVVPIEVSAETVQQRINQLQATGISQAEGIEFSPNEVLGIRIKGDAVTSDPLARNLKALLVNPEGVHIGGLNFPATGVVEGSRGKGLIIMFEEQWNDPLISEHETIELGLVLSNPQRFPNQAGAWAAAHDLTVRIMAQGQPIDHSTLAAYQGTIGAAIFRDGQGISFEDLGPDERDLGLQQMREYLGRLEQSEELFDPDENQDAVAQRLDYNVGFASLLGRILARYHARSDVAKLPGAEIHIARRELALAEGKTPADIALDEFREFVTMAKRQHPDIAAMIGQYDEGLIKMAETVDGESSAHALGYSDRFAWHFDKLPRTLMSQNIIAAREIMGQGLSNEELIALFRREFYPRIVIPALDNLVAQAQINDMEDLNFTEIQRGVASMVDYVDKIRSGDIDFYLATGAEIANQIGIITRAFELMYDAFIRPQDTLTDYYRVLGIPRDASADEIRAAFLRLCHATLTSGTITESDQQTALIEAVRAFTYLSIPQMKEEYDKVTEGAEFIEDQMSQDEAMGIEEFAGYVQELETAASERDWRAARPHQPVDQAVEAHGWKTVTARKLYAELMDQGRTRDGIHRQEVAPARIARRILSQARGQEISGLDEFREFIQSIKAGRPFYSPKWIIEADNPKNMAYLYGFSEAFTPYVMKFYQLWQSGLWQTQYYRLNAQQALVAVGNLVIAQAEIENFTELSEEDMRQGIQEFRNFAMGLQRDASKLDLSKSGLEVALEQRITSRGFELLYDILKDLWRERRLDAVLSYSEQESPPPISAGGFWFELGIMAYQQTGSLLPQGMALSDAIVARDTLVPQIASELLSESQQIAANLQSSQPTVGPGFRDYYKILGVTNDARPQDIDTAYQAARGMYLARMDEAGIQSWFVRKSKAYRVLSDQGSRDLYDREGAQAVEAALMRPHPQPQQDSSRQRPPGGIDMNALWLDLQIQGDGTSSTPPATTWKGEVLQFNGLTPFIFNITPLPSLMPLLGWDKAPSQKSSQKLGSIR